MRTQYSMWPDLPVSNTKHPHRPNGFSSATPTEPLLFPLCWAWVLPFCRAVRPGAACGLWDSLAPCTKTWWAVFGTHQSAARVPPQTRMCVILRITCQGLSHSWASWPPMIFMTGRSHTGGGQSHLCVTCDPRTLGKRGCAPFLTSIAPPPSPAPPSAGVTRCPQGPCCSRGPHGSGAKKPAPRPAGTGILLRGRRDGIMVSCCTVCHTRVAPSP